MTPLPRPLPSDPAAVRELVRATVGGDRDAREQLARWCQPRVRRTVYLACGPDDIVEDLTQMAMARVFRRMETFRGDASFSIWVDRVTLNVVRRHFSRRRWALLVRYDEAAASHQVSPGDNTAARAEQTRAMRRLARHLSGIKPEWRLPLVLVLQHGYSVPELAVILGLRFETAKKRLYRGRLELVRRLRDDPYFQALSRELES
jgi:RNA polymerase sigma-70 factor (ECF subfamily)